MAENVIELEGVGLTLRSRAGDIEILKGVDLRVAQGETVAIVGPSGSGKTSLLMVMAGLERATSGSARVAGHELGGLDEDALARVRSAAIGIVFQSFHLVPTMTAHENVALPLEFRGIAGARERARGALDEVGLGGRLEHYPAQLSGGEQQRVALARALVSQPRLLLADEPTGNLDGATGRQVIDLILGLGRRHGATLVLVTHDEALAARCSRVLRMTDGCIVADTGSRTAGVGTAAPVGDRTGATA
ncbi:MAG: ABC transporter ATP-binding protein [Hyphomicrobiaceae bacterium]|nr:ABC transporter ATP-binding protein [Hyphomicrobiaceae bacterium]